ncbi:sensor histidine kinase [Marivirga lumbricoides]
MKRIRKFIFLNLGIAFVLMVMFCPKCFLSWEGVVELIPDFIFSFLMSSTLSFGGFMVESYFDKKMSWIKFPVKRLLLTVTTYLLYSFIASYLLTAVFTILINDAETIRKIDWVKMMDNTILPVIVALIIITIFTARSWLYEWRNAAIETEQLRSERLAGQYQSLKDQLNPHFLFNSLNVLSSLVYESADQSAAFIQQLSKIYRYVLDVQQEELVPLSREVEFAKNYLSLQKLRFDDSLTYTISISTMQGYYLPPLSLQLLLENAIKHNVISNKNPLQITIKQEGESLEVSNNFQPKQTKEIESSGIGLENIKKRYELLSDRAPQIREIEKAYIVILPLLKVEK